MVTVKKEYGQKVDQTSVECPSPKTCMDYGKGVLKCGTFKEHEYKGPEEVRECRDGNIVKMVRLSRKDDPKRAVYSAPKMVKQCPLDAPCFFHRGEAQSRVERVWSAMVGERGFRCTPAEPNESSRLTDTSSD